MRAVGWFCFQNESKSALLSLSSIERKAKGCNTHPLRPRFRIRLDDPRFPRPLSLHLGRPSSPSLVVLRLESGHAHDGGEEGYDCEVGRERKREG